MSWSKNPVFQHLVQKTMVVASASGLKSAGVPLRKQLEGTKAEDILVTIRGK